MFACKRKKQRNRKENNIQRSRVGGDNIREKELKQTKKRKREREGEREREREKERERIKWERERESWVLFFLILRIIL